MVDTHFGNFGEEFGPPPTPRLNELSVQSAETGGEKSRQGSRGSAYCPGLPAALPSLRQVDHVAARGTGRDG